jgi:V8-like Glu-specific endopeptidase
MRLTANCPEPHSLVDFWDGRPKPGLGPQTGIALAKPLLPLAIALALGAFSGAAQAQVAAPILTGQTRSGASWSALEEATGMERRLTSLPRSMFSFTAPPGNPGTPRIVTGKPGPTGDAALDPPEAGSPEADAGNPFAGARNLNTIYAYAESAVDSEARDNFPHSAIGHYAFVAADGKPRRCTAALISRSIAVTAGQCVHQGGDKPLIQRQDGWNKPVNNSYGVFVPARGPGAQPDGPFGYASVHAVVTTDGWFSNGLVNQGYDVALLVLGDRAGSPAQIGDATGWLGFCYSNCLQPYFALSQLGYPANYYGGGYMIEGGHLARNVNNTDYYFGSGQQAGSSGAPQIANISPLMSSADGQPANIVLGVTSWGFSDDTYRVQGASSLSGPGNSNDFPALWNAACEIAQDLHGASTCAILP